MMLIYRVINAFDITPTVEYFPERKSKISVTIPRKVLEEREQQTKALYAFKCYNTHDIIKALVNNDKFTLEEKYKKLIGFYNRSNKIKITTITSKKVT
jgi:hypothetical protein